MVSRKPVIKKDKEEKIVEDTSRKPNKKISAGVLPDAIQEGKWIVPIGGEVLIQRPRAGKKMNQSICVVKNIEGDRIDTFDATLEQWYNFTVSDAIKHGLNIKVYRMVP